MIEEETVQEFLGQRHLALLGASNNPKNFGNTIYRELRDHGHEVVPVNPNSVIVEGEPCYPDLASVPGPIDGVVVMVGGDKSADVVRACVERDIKYVWLFKGIGGAGAVSDEALDLCRQNGMHVVAGACPLIADSGGFRTAIPIDSVQPFRRFSYSLRRSSTVRV